MIFFRHGINKVRAALFLTGGVLLVLAGCATIEGGIGVEMPLPDEVLDYYHNHYISSIRDKTIFSHTGRNVLDTIGAETRRRGVRVIEEAAAVRLLTGQGQVTGAVALDYLHGRWLTIRARTRTESGLREILLN